MGTTTVEVPLSEPVRARLKEVAQRTGRAEKETAAILIECALAADDLEAEIIRSRLAEAEAGGPFARHDEVLAWLRGLCDGKRASGPDAITIIDWSRSH